MMMAWSAGAAPQVEIRAQTQVNLDRVRLHPDGGVEITGSLADKFTGEPIASQTVRIAIGGREVTAVTGPDGRFTMVVDVPPGPQQIQLAFPGASRLDGSELSTTTDPAKAQVLLSLRAEETPQGLAVQLGATVDGQPVAVPVQLSIGAPTDPELKLLKTVPANQPMVLSRAESGGPGPRRLRASFRGDDTRQPATTEATIEVTTTTTTTMTVSDTSLAFEDELVVTGMVTDEAGRPVPRVPVSLASGDRRLAQGATNSDGKYRFELEAEILGKGQWGVGTQTEPTSTFIKPSRAAPVIVTIAAPQPVPVLYTWAAFVATALAAGGFFLFRAKPWRKLRRPAAPAEVPEQDHSNEDAVAGGLVAAKPGIVSTLRRPQDDTFSGVVRDTVRGRAVPDAIVRLTLEGQQHELATAEDGSFTFEQLAVGDWAAEVAAPGHVTERFVVTIPHRGELRGVRVDLVPVRERVFQLYRRAAEPALPEPRLWGIWSPRQIVDHVRAKRPSQALAELTDFVEEVYFSARVSGETILPGASERVDRAIKERARPPAA